MRTLYTIFSLGLGYLMGCLSPSAWIGRKKHVNLKETGTKNLGATNTALTLGRKAGYFVLFFDMLKSIVSYKLARLLFPQMALMGLVAGIGVIVGHCFPVFLDFDGGMGLAAFGGLVLAHDPLMFAVLLTIGLLVAFLLDYGVYLAISASVLFPIACFLRSGDLRELILAAIAGGIIAFMHRTNLLRAIRQEDPIHVRSGLKKIFGSKQ